MPTHNTTVNIGGTLIECEVDFTIDSYGEPASFDDPGCGPSISINSVKGVEFGRDFTELLNDTYTAPFNVYIARRYVEPYFDGMVIDWQRTDTTPELIHYSGTALEVIEGEILADDRHFDYSAEEYDRDNW